MDAWQSAWVEVLPDFKNFTRKANSEMTSVLGAAGTAGGVVAGKNMGGGILAAIPKLAGPLIAAFAALGLGNLIGQAVGSGIRYGLDAVDLASALGESFNAVQVTFGEEIAADLKVLAEQAPESLKVTRRTFNEFATRFSAFGKTIVGEGGDVVGFLDDLTTRGADFASVYNLDVADALQLFQSGLAGESEPLRKYGIDLSEATVRTFAYQSGIAAAGSELTEAQKIQARYAAILAQTSAVQGDAANTAGEYAGQTRLFAVALEEAQTKFGEAFLPVATDILVWANSDLIPILEGALDKSGPALEQSIRDVMPEVKDLIETAADNLPGAIEAAIGLLGAASDSFELDFGAGNKGIFDPAAWETLTSDMQGFWDFLNADIQFTDEYWKQTADGFNVWWQRFNDINYRTTQETSDEIKAYWKTTVDQMRADTEELAAGGTLLGAQFAQGFADGIETETEAAALAAERMALAARDKVIGTMQIQSPSKVMHELGGFVAAGFAGGITDGTPDVDSAMGALVAVPNVQVPTPKINANTFGAATAAQSGMRLEGRIDLGDGLSGYFRGTLNDVGKASL